MSSRQMKSRDEGPSHRRRPWRGWPVWSVLLLLAACKPVPPPETTPEPPGVTTVRLLPTWGGLFRQDGAPSEVVEGLTRGAFNAELRQRRERGERLLDFESNPDPAGGGERRFAGLWTAGADPAERWEAVECRTFEARRHRHAADGRHLVDFERWRRGEAEICAGLWHGGSRGEELEPGMPCDRFEAHQARLEGRRLADFEVWEADGVRMCAGLWHPGEGGERLLVGAELEKLESWLADRDRAGMRLADLEIHCEGNRLLYSGLWRAGREAYWLWLGDERPCLDERHASLRGGVAPGGMVPSCPEEPPDDGHDHDGEEHPSATGGKEPAPLGPGEPLPGGLPPLHLVDLELGLRQPPAPEPAAAVRAEDPTIHLGVEHDGGSSGPEG